MTEEPCPGQSNLKKTREVNWLAVLFFIHIHLLSCYGITLLIFETKLLTIFLLIFLCSIAILGVTTGAHRLWAHRTYKASTKLKIVLMLCQTLVGNGPIYDWVQQHRFHHKHFKTDADPYDIRKGFLFAHFFSRMRKLSEYQESLKNSIDMSDIAEDSVVMFQKKYYWVLYAIFFILLPVNAPMEYWNDSVLSSAIVMGFLRYGIVLHATWLVESSVAFWGLKEGEKFPPDSNSVFIMTKSYWPEYHYLHPQDYKSGEYGTYDSGCSTAFIRVFAALGEATDLHTLETVTLQRALSESVKLKRPLPKCIASAISQQELEKDHFLKHK